MAKSRRFSKFLRFAEEEETFPKDEFLEYYEQNQKDMSKRQAEYNKALTRKFRTRNETNLEAAYDRSIRKYEKEREDLKASLYVAQGITHRKQNSLYLQKIQCHVDCQELLDEDKKRMRAEISNLEREIGRLDKDILGLKMTVKKTAVTPEQVKKVKRQLEILENQLEVGVRRECSFASVNSILRDEIKRRLHERTLFNEAYSIHIQKLNSGKKYFTEVQEFAMNIVENCIMAYERIDAANKKHAKELNVRKKDVATMLRSKRLLKNLAKFVECKGKRRKLLPLEPKEVRRREKFREEHTAQINEYRMIISKMLHYTNSRRVGQVIQKYRDQESLYYSFFSYSNELSYHITLINNSVSDLFQNIELLKSVSAATKENQYDLIYDLELMLERKQESNQILTDERNAVDHVMLNLCGDFDILVSLTKCDISSLQELLGENTHVDLFNMRHMLKKLEHRVSDIIAVIYMSERNQSARGKKLVKKAAGFCEKPTPLHDVVLAQQCAECAEGEAVNVEDNTEVFLHSKEDIRKAIYEKVTQPELQYRLHSMSQCRLPRSRMLAAKRAL